MMTKENLLSEMIKGSSLKVDHIERASQILGAVEGLRIWEARELLENCIGALQQLDVCYRVAREETTS